MGDLSEAVQQLWDMDDNRCILGKDVRINVQNSKKPYWKEDGADEKLFSYVSPSLKERPTYVAFRALLDNYDPDVGTSEVLTDAERHEISTFLQCVCDTKVMKFCHKYCIKHSNGKHDIPEDFSDFSKLLHTVWFELYHRSRGGRPDSSGFEHVFVGEIKNNEISGFHNWIQFYNEEKKGNIDYRGYIKPRGSSSNEESSENDDYVLTIQFRWNGVEKFVGSTFIGTSPEFEFALYTLCFLCGNENNYVNLDTGRDSFKLNIKCYTIDDNKIGTTFPEVVEHVDD